MHIYNLYIYICCFCPLECRRSDIEALQKDPLEEPWSSEVETGLLLGSFRFRV